MRVHSIGSGYAPHPSTLPTFRCFSILEWEFNQRSTEPVGVQYRAMGTAYTEFAHPGIYERRWRAVLEPAIEAWETIDAATATTIIRQILKLVVRRSERPYSRTAERRAERGGSLAAAGGALSPSAALQQICSKLPGSNPEPDVRTRPRMTLLDLAGVSSILLTGASLGAQTPAPVPDARVYGCQRQVQASRGGQPPWSPITCSATGCCSSRRRSTSARVCSRRKTESRQKAFLPAAQKRRVGTSR